MKYISLLGATGSIGTQTIDIIREHKEYFSLVAMSIGRNLSLARKMIIEFSPKLVSTIEKNDAEILQAEFPSVTFSYGEKGINDVAVYDNADILVNAVTGSVGLQPTLQAIEAKK